jgi:hypothetical protein
VAGAFLTRNDLAGRSRAVALGLSVPMTWARQLTATMRHLWSLVPGARFGRSDCACFVPRPVVSRFLEDATVTSPSIFQPAFKACGGLLSYSIKIGSSPERSGSCRIILRMMRACFRVGRHCPSPDLFQTSRAKSCAQGSVAWRMTDGQSCMILRSDGPSIASQSVLRAMALSCRALTA